jgi:diphthamide synthase subunit DPH2
MKICLCGSTRFMDQFHAANVALSLAGHVVYSVATSTKGDFQPTEDQKIALDAVHLSKIEESDAVMVVGYQEDGTTYIGDSTRREIAFARMRDKEVFFYDPAQAVSGPARQFEGDLNGAAETNAAREARQAEAEARKAEFMNNLMGGGRANVSDEDEDVDHSGDPEASKNGEEVTN